MTDDSDNGSKQEITGARTHWVIEGQVQRLCALVLPADVLLYTYSSEEPCHHHPSFILYATTMATPRSPLLSCPAQPKVQLSHTHRRTRDGNKQTNKKRERESPFPVVNNDLCTWSILLVPFSFFFTLPKLSLFIFVSSVPEPEFVFRVLMMTASV